MFDFDKNEREEKINSNIKYLIIFYMRSLFITYTFPLECHHRHGKIIFLYNPFCFFWFSLFCSRSQKNQIRGKWAKTKAKSIFIYCNKKCYMTTFINIMYAMRICWTVFQLQFVFPRMRIIWIMHFNWIIFLYYQNDYSNMIFDHREKPG